MRSAQPSSTRMRFGRGSAGTKEDYWDRAVSGGLISRELRCLLFLALPDWLAASRIDLYGCYRNGVGPDLDSCLGVSDEVELPGWLVRGDGPTGEDRPSAVVKVLIDEWCHSLSAGLRATVVEQDHGHPVEHWIRDHPGVCPELIDYALVELVHVEIGHDVLQYVTDSTWSRIRVSGAPITLAASMMLGQTPQPRWASQRGSERLARTSGRLPG